MAFDYDVFLSYSSRDKKAVRALAKRLKDDGLRVWLDDWVIQPGDPISLKIQRGLEASRILLMCMSEAYFDSEWATLEHHTLLFRDPTNAQRRFIPLLLADCAPPDIIAQFAHIDWRTPSDESYARLLDACRGGEAETVELVPQEEQVDQAAMPEDLQEAATAQAVHLWKYRDQLGVASISADGASLGLPPADLLPMVRKTLDRYRRYPL